MAEYIERGAVLEMLKQECSPMVFAYLADMVNDIPAADVRPVVTCGECKHWFENGTDYCSCDRDALLRERDFFCADGEKREES